MPAEKIISESEVSTFRSNKFMVKFGIIQSVTELNLVIDPQLKFAKHLKKFHTKPGSPAVHAWYGFFRIFHSA